MIAFQPLCSIFVNNFLLVVNLDSGLVLGFFLLLELILVGLVPRVVDFLLLSAELVPCRLVFIRLTTPFTPACPTFLLRSTAPCLCKLTESSTLSQISSKQCFPIYAVTLEKWIGRLGETIRKRVVTTAFRQFRAHRAPALGVVH